jgi:hypothetical protein
MPLSIGGSARALRQLSLFLLPSLGWISICEARLRVGQAADHPTPLPAPSPLPVVAPRPTRQVERDPAAGLNYQHPEKSFVEAAGALFDLQQPSSRARLTLQTGQRLTRQRRRSTLLLPAHSLLVLPEVQCAPTYRTALRLQVRTERAGSLEVLAAAEAAAWGGSDLEAPDCTTLHRLSLAPGDTTASLSLPDLERLAPNQPTPTLLVVRFIPNEAGADCPPCQVQALELRGLSPAGA